MYKIGNGTLCGGYHDICQDFSYVEKVTDDCVLAVIADGVGSAQYSQEGSKLVVETITDFVKNEITDTSFEVLSTEDGMFRCKLLTTMQKGFELALEKLVQISNENEISIDEYSTTLSAMLIYDQYVVWGHSGDGAILSIQEDGNIIMLTTEQSGMQSGEVYPLDAGKEYWSFGISENNATAYMLMTDGVLGYVLSIAKSDNISKYFYNLLAGAAKNEADNLDEHINKIISLKNLTRYTKDDRTMALIMNEEKRIPEYADYEYTDMSQLIPANSYNECYSKSIEQYLEADCRGCKGVTFDEFNIFTGIIQTDSEYRFRTILSVNCLMDMCKEEGLYRCLDVAKNCLGTLRFLWNYNPYEEIHETEEMTDDDFLVWKNSNILGTTLRICEYKDYMVCDFCVEKSYLQYIENISNITVSYRYQWGAMLYKLISRRKKEQAEMSIESYEIQSVEFPEEIKTERYCELVQKLTLADEKQNEIVETNHEEDLDITEA